MKVSIKYPNPLTEEQEVLNDICSKIEQPIVLKSNKSQGSFYSATASFGEGSPEFIGYAERDGSELKTVLKAQICAIVNLLKSNGYEVDFLLSSNNNEKAKPTKKVETINRYFITSAPDVDYAIKELEKMGVDTTDIKVYRDDLMSKGERLTKNKLAEFMFPARSKTVISVESEDKKRPAKRVEPISKPVYLDMGSMRDPNEADKIIQNLKEIGVDEKTYNTLSYFSRYNSLTLFSLYASDDEVNELIKCHK